MAISKSMCVGCRNDFYNGKNPPGVKTCWSFKGARVVERIRVGTWQSPPYKWRPHKTLNCYHCEGGVLLGRNDPRVVEPQPAGKSNGPA